MNEFSLSEIFPVSITGEWGNEPAGSSNAYALRAADFTKDCKLRSEIGVPRRIPLGKLEAKALKNGDILIEKSGGSPDQPVGRVVFFDREDPKTRHIHSNFLQLLRVSDGFDPRFSYYLLSFLYFSGYVYRYQQQTTGIINLKLENYLRERVRVPSTGAQERIAQILQTIDEAIEKTEVLIEKYQQIKAGLMQDLFTRGIGPDGKLRPPRDEAPELYQETPIGWIPNDWWVKGILEVGNVVDPNPSHRNPIYHENGFPFISTVEFIDDDQVEVDTPRRVIEEIVLEQEKRCEFAKGSIAFSRKGTIGTIRFLPEYIRFALLDSLCVINPVNIDPVFLFNALRSSSVQKQIKNMTVGQALPQMSIGRVRELQILSPSCQNEQKEIGKRLSAISGYVSKNHAELKKLKKMKCGLMSDLLNGNVRVKFENYEAVDV
ncbi:restriction endonuclease subunit S [Marinobacter alexandrii]|uniref:restriction endonuclease subunit S n=1 Tax=Marinobacter alexandrii TaxID=2570351 RepID=UPI0014866446|nr:restriction endonuclease subunit S [Marinobacter alexandrii]